MWSPKHTKKEDPRLPPKNYLLTLFNKSSKEVLLLIISNNFLSSTLITSLLSIPKNSLILIPKITQISLNKSTSGIQIPCFHLLTEPILTPNLLASSIPVIPKMSNIDFNCPILKDEEVHVIGAYIPLTDSTEFNEET